MRGPIALSELVANQRIGRACVRYTQISLGKCKQCDPLTGVERILLQETVDPAAALRIAQLAEQYRGRRARTHPRITVESRSRNQIAQHRSEEHTSELQSLMRTSYAVFCL